MHQESEAFNERCARFGKQSGDPSERKLVDVKALLQQAKINALKKINKT